MSVKRAWTTSQKMAILDEAFAPGASVLKVAERHEINTGQLYTWRRLLLERQLDWTQTCCADIRARKYGA